MHLPPPNYHTVLGLSRLSGVSRTIIYRLLAERRLEADAFVIERDIPLPLFLAERAIDVVRAQRRSPASKIFNSGSEPRSPVHPRVEPRSAA